MAKNKETSTRGTGKGQKLFVRHSQSTSQRPSATSQNFPQAEPDRDFYRAHGNTRRCIERALSTLQGFRSSRRAGDNAGSSVE